MTYVVLVSCVLFIVAFLSLYCVYRFVEEDSIDNSFGLSAFYAGCFSIVIFLVFACIYAVSKSVIIIMTIGVTLLISIIAIVSIEAAKNKKSVDTVNYDHYNKSDDVVKENTN